MNLYCSTTIQRKSDTIVLNPGIIIYTSSNTWLDRNLRVLEELPEMDDFNSIYFLMKSDSPVWITKVNRELSLLEGHINWFYIKQINGNKRRIRKRMEELDREDLEKIDFNRKELSKIRLDKRIRNFLYQ